MKKQLYYLVINGSDAPPVSMEVYNIMSTDEILLSIAHQLRSPVDMLRILTQRDRILSVFSVLDYLAQHEFVFTQTDFQRFIEDVRRYIQSISLSDLFWVWYAQFDASVILQDPSETADILRKFSLPFGYDDLGELRRDWDRQQNERLESMEEAYDKMEHRLERLYTNPCPMDTILPFVIRKTRIQFTLTSPHSLYFLMDSIKLSTEWNMAIHKDLVRYHPSLSFAILSSGVYDKEYTASLQERLEERDEEDVGRLLILHQDLDQCITIASSKERAIYNVTMDVVPFDDIRTMRGVLTSILGISPFERYETVSISGTFYIKDVVYEKLTFQDFVMNDDIASYYMYVNELEKAYRHGENVTVHFEKNVSAILINNRNDTSTRPPSLSYFQGNYVKVNIVRASGSQQNTDVVARFQQVLCILLRRFMQQYPEYHPLYAELLPTHPVFPELTSDEPIETTRNFADKYKNIFKKTGYKTSCRPKTRMPTIVSQEEARALNPLKVIKFPKPNDPKLDIPSEYLTCDDPAYPFPGIASLGGGDLFVPCCFNKNPRSSRAFVEYYQGTKTAEPKGTEHVKSEFQIIKTFGDLGRLPASIHQFMIALLPKQTFLRAGTVDSSTSILHSLAYMTGRHATPQSDAVARRDFASFFGTNLKVCQSENIGFSIDEIARDLGNVDVPLDPRRFIRLLEIYFDVNIVIFVRTKKEENFEMMCPHHRQFFLRYDFVPTKPFVFLYEHWGTSPDRYTKRLHPVYEMIVSVLPSVDVPRRSFALTNPQRKRLTDVYRNVFQVYPLGQNIPLLPFASPPSESIPISQLLDDKGKLRTILVKSSTNTNPDRYIPFESMHPLPPIFVRNEEPTVSTDVLDRAFLNPLSLDDVVKASPFESTDVVRLTEYRRQHYAILACKEYMFKVPILPPTRSAVERVRLPIMTLTPIVETPPSIDLVHKQRLGRMLMDYVLYLYASAYYDERKGDGWNDDYAKFMDMHTLVVPGYAYPDPNQVSELVDGNPLMMNPGTNKLIVDSETLRQKLVFVLRYHRQYTSPSLVEHRDMTILPHFWQVPYDFESWRQVQTLPAFERFIRTGHVPPYSVHRESLSTLTSAKGYWYHHDERPVREWTCPYRYINVETEEDAVSLTLYWRKYRTIPNFRITDEVVDAPDLHIMRYQPEDRTWSSTADIATEDPVFVVRTVDDATYVLLEMKN